MQYWPNKGKILQCGGYSVKNLREQNKGDYIVRRFKVTKTHATGLKKTKSKTKSGAEEPERIIYQYHFIGWPDHGVPIDTIGLLNMIEDIDSRIEKYDLQHNRLVVHCR